MVLATDMSCHFQQVKVMKSLLQQPETWVLDFTSESVAMLIWKIFINSDSDYSEWRFSIHSFHGIGSKGYGAYMQNSYVAYTKWCQVIKSFIFPVRDLISFKVFDQLHVLNIIHLLYAVFAVIGVALTVKLSLKCNQGSFCEFYPSQTFVEKHNLDVKGTFKIDRIFVFRSKSFSMEC